MRYLTLIAYTLIILAANWLIVRFGIIPVGFGLLAPAGVYAVGLAFPLRDYIQRVLGRRWAIVAILAGTALSYVVSPTFALASGFTFLVSESVDMLIYTPLQKRFPIAVVLSSVCALVVDSALFLWLAFRSEQFLLGQIVGKTEATAAGACVILLLWRRREILARDAHATMVSTD
jgi:queuosine precursor transporter